MAAAAAVTVQPEVRAKVVTVPAAEVPQQWLRSQAVNLTRHAAALRPFRRQEFGASPCAPSEGHIQAVNRLVGGLRRQLLKMSRVVATNADTAVSEPATANLQRLVHNKEAAHRWVQGIEKIWDFYFELFGQRQSRYAEWLVSCDRIALDCYQDVYMGLGKAKSIPAPPPFSYMRTGFSPATYRRGMPLSKLGKQINPFPLVQLPYHRLINPWTLGAVLHEVSHNIQNDLGLQRTIPLAIARHLLDAGFPSAIAKIFTRWNRETFADLSGLLLGGPAIVGSLMDVVGRSSATVKAFDPRGVHPTPYLRPYLSFELLRRMGFARQAEQYQRLWTRMYPNPQSGSIPQALLASAPQAIPVVVDAICYRPFSELGGKGLAEVISFGEKEQHMVEEAAQRLAAGTDPGVVPERFLIGAARFAFEQRFARAGIVARNFYQELARR